MSKARSAWSSAPRPVVAAFIAVLGVVLCMAPAPCASAAPSPSPSPASSTATARSTSKPTNVEVPSATKPDSNVCVDVVGVLGSVTCSKVAAILDVDERLTTDEIAVLVVRTTGDETIEHYATRTFNSWGIGRADKNNGVLLLVAIDDRALRIEVGTGLEKTLTDGEAEEIIYGTITPQFSTGDYRSGILAGLDAIRRQLKHAVTSTNALAGLADGADSGITPPTTSRNQYAYDSDDEGRSGSSGGGGVLWIILLVAVMVIGWAWSAYRRANGYDDGDDDSSHDYRRSSYRSRGFRSFGSSRRSSGSSSRSSSRSSFGGGRSRGGGGSGSW